MASRHSCPFCRLVGSFSSCRNSFYRCKRCGNISKIWEVDLEILDDVQVDRLPGKTVIKTKPTVTDRIEQVMDVYSIQTRSKRSYTKPTVTNRIEQVMDVDSIQTRSKRSYTKYLVKWRDSPNADFTWINEATFRKADPEYYEAYVAGCAWIDEAIFLDIDPKYYEAYVDRIFKRASSSEDN